ncbi:MAG: gluconate 2-dehydrogenase subunit 3 family protein [Woeseia sp.]
MIQQDKNQSGHEPSDNDASQGSRLGRRTFLLRGGAALATAAALAGLPYALRRELTRETSFVLFSARQREAVQAVQEHLFPGEPQAPGAADINAAAYLEWAITAPGIDPDTRNTIVNGVGRLEDASRERFELLFHDLGPEQREQLLRYLADQTRWGRAWLSLMLYYIFEALLSDPVYGGNPEESGWRWLEHKPGFPTPPADKIYGRL